MKVKTLLCFSIIWVHTNLEGENILFELHIKVVGGKKTDIPRDRPGQRRLVLERIARGERVRSRIKQREGGVIVACVIIYCAVVVPRGWNLISPYNRKLGSLLRSEWIMKKLIRWINFVSRCGRENRSIDGISIILFFSKV